MQINGKLRDRISVPVGIADAVAEKLALASETIQKYLDGNVPKKVIVVAGKLVNIVV